MPVWPTATTSSSRWTRTSLTIRPHCPISCARASRAPARRDLLVSKLFTVFWGLVAVSFAAFAALLDNLIQAVNIFGSIFYGTVLGLFVVAFFVRRVTATPVLLAALVAQAAVFALFFLSDLGFLWYNVVGCGVVVVLSLALELSGLGDR